MMLPVDNRLGVSRGLDALSQRSTRSAANFQIGEATSEAASSPNPLSAVQQPEGGRSSFEQPKDHSEREAAQTAAAAVEAKPELSAPASADVLSVRFDPELGRVARSASARNASGRTFGRLRPPLRTAVAPEATRTPSLGIRGYQRSQQLAHAAATPSVNVVL